MSFLTIEFTKRVRHVNLKQVREIYLYEDKIEFVFDGGYSPTNYFKDIKHSYLELLNLLKKEFIERDTEGHSFRNFVNPDFVFFIDIDEHDITLQAKKVHESLICRASSNNTLITELLGEK